MRIWFSSLIKATAHWTQFVLAKIHISSTLLSSIILYPTILLTSLSFFCFRSDSAHIDIALWLMPQCTPRSQQRPEKGLKWWLTALPELTTTLREEETLGVRYSVSGSPHRSFTSSAIYSMRPAASACQSPAISKITAMIP